MTGGCLRHKQGFLRRMQWLEAGMAGGSATLWLLQPLQEDEISCGVQPPELESLSSRFSAPPPEVGGGGG